MFFLGFELVHQVAILELSICTVRTTRSTHNHSRTGVGFSWSIGHFCAGFILSDKNTSGTGLHKAAPGGCRIGLGAGTPDEERLESPLSRLTFVVGCPVWRLSRSPGIAPQSSLRSIEILSGEQRVRVFRSGGGLIGGSEGEVSETAIV